MRFRCKNALRQTVLQTNVTGFVSAACRLKGTAPLTAWPYCSCSGLCAGVSPCQKPAVRTEEREQQAGERSRRSDDPGELRLSHPRRRTNPGRGEGASLSGNTSSRRGAHGRLSSVVWFYLLDYSFSALREHHPVTIACIHWKLHTGSYLEELLGRA